VERLSRPWSTYANSVEGANGALSDELRSERLHVLQLDCAKAKFVRKNFSNMSEDYDGIPAGDEPHFNLPNTTSRLRACLSCKIILSAQQFTREGCPNCRESDMVGNKQAVEELTTRNYSGTAAVIDPSRSWVARNIKADRLLPGVYAIVVQGFSNEMPERDEYELE
jgi:transcription elongation factor SPT4